MGSKEERSKEEEMGFVADWGARGLERGAEGKKRGSGRFSLFMRERERERELDL